MVELKTFFDQFELLADAPNGVQKLRELILQLAVQGKLVTQDPNDEPASVLLERIKAEKERLVKEGKIKKTEKLPAIKADEIPYALPDSWEWVRLGNLIFSITGGGTPSKNNPHFWNGNIPWASVKDLKESKYLNKTIDFITEQAIQKSTTNLITKGRVIVCTRMGLGKIAINKIDVAINQDLKALEFPSEFDINYFYNFYLTQNITGTGVTVSGIRQAELLNFLVPLPPLNEQRRIVAKVDQLMALCDELETRQQKKQQHILHLGEAATSKLITVSTPLEFNQNWRQICENFGLIYSIPENVKQLRQAILQLAVMGKLVPQDINDEPASVLLEKINAEKEQLIKEGKIKKEKDVSPIKRDELPYELPKSWEWKRLGHLCNYVIDCLHSTPQFVETGKMCIDTTCIEQGKILFSKIRRVSDDVFDERIRRLKPEAGDILFSREGTIGISVIVPNNLEICLGQRMMMFRVSNFVLSEYFRYVLISEMFVKQWSSKLTGTAARHVNISDLKRMLFPLPPLKEQHRIVAKIDQLMSLCDELETQLTQATSKRERLMETAIRQVLAA